MFGIERLLQRKPRQLSGGERQRVALAPGDGARSRRSSSSTSRSPTSTPSSAPCARDELQAVPAAAGHHHHLRHPRPGGGDGPRRPDRGDERGEGPAAGTPAGGLRRAGRHLRRRVPRHPADEPGRASTGCWSAFGPSRCFPGRLAAGRRGAHVRCASRSTAWRTSARGACSTGRCRELAPNREDDRQPAGHGALHRSRPGTPTTSPSRDEPQVLRHGHRARAARPLPADGGGVTAPALVRPRFEGRTARMTTARWLGRLMLAPALLYIAR